MNIRVKTLALSLGALFLTACGTSTEGSRYLMQNGVADSGYPPKGSGTDPGSPALSSLSKEIDEKGMEAEPRPAPKENIPSNVASTPRT